MKSSVLLLVVALSALSRPMSAWAATSKAAEAAIAESVSDILQGDSRRAVSALQRVPQAEFVGYDAQYRACMMGRFDRTTRPYLATAIADPLVGQVLELYRDYWWHALESPSSRDSFASALLARLNRLLGAKAKDFDSLEPSLREVLERHGYHALLGLSPPLQELMLWTRQEERTYEVNLPEGRPRVQVELLDDFDSLGWSAYGRCERGSNGGWATGDRLYAVVPYYRSGLAGEHFRVVFLGHETQHFADRHRFPNMAAWEFEYRAKLVELIQADEVSETRLRGFITAQGDDPRASHPYANRRLIEDLRAKLGAEPDQVTKDKLKKAALELLSADTLRRTRKLSGSQR